MRRGQLGIAIAAGAIALAPIAASATDIPVPAKVHLIKQDKNAGFVAKLAKVVNKPAVKGTTFPIPAPGGMADPTVTGGTLRFCKLATAGTSATWTEVSLPAANWKGLGNPAGSKGYKYKGAGTLADPCKVVLVKEKVIKAVCKGPGAFDSPSPFSLPVGSAGVGWELNLGTDRYCAESSAATGADVKKDDAAKGIWKAIKAAAPASCPVVATPTPTPTPTPPYGSASRAFLGGSQASLLQ